LCAVAGGKNAALKAELPGFLDAGFRLRYAPNLSGQTDFSEKNCFRIENVLDPKTVFFGEVGLAGEIRGVSQAETRIKEAGKLGFERCILPASNSAQLKHIKHPK